MIHRSEALLILPHDELQEQDKDVGSQAISAVIVDEHAAPGGTGAAPCTPKARAGGRAACSASFSAEPPAVLIRAHEGEAAVMLPPRRVVCQIAVLFAIALC